MHTHVDWQAASWQSHGLAFDKRWYSASDIDTTALNYGSQSSEAWGAAARVPEMCGVDLHWSGRRGFEPPHLEDQSTDEGSSTCTMDIGSEAVKSPDGTPSDASRRSRHQVEAGWSDLNCEGAYYDQLSGFPIHGSHVAREFGTAWAAQGIHANHTCDFETPFLATVGATSSSPTLMKGATGQVLGSVPSHPEAHDAYSFSPFTAYQPPPFLGTSPWGVQGTGLAGSPVPPTTAASVHAPEVAAASMQPCRLSLRQDLAPAGPNDAPLKVLMTKFECEVFPLDPRFPAKKRPPNW